MTYTESKKQCEAILRSHKIGESTNQEETNLLNAFFRFHHPDWFQKTNGEEVIRYDVKDSGIYGTKCLYLVTANNTTDIGFKGCLKVIKINEAYMDLNIYAACRNTIDKQIISPLRKKIESKLHAGEVVKSDVSSQIITSMHELHIDHYDKQFREVVAEFIKQEGRDYLFSKINMGEQNSPVTKFVDLKIVERFIAFHEANTKLRVLTRDENLSQRYKNTK